MSDDLRTGRGWARCTSSTSRDLDTDLNLFPNKDTVFFPEPVPGPDGEPSYAMLHRPMWDLGWFREGEGVHLPAGVTDDRPGIWISYVPVAEVEADIAQARRTCAHHRLVAMSEYPFEELKIGAGPAPLRVDEGWLLIHHGVTGDDAEGLRPDQQQVSYAAGALLLDPDDPTRVLARTAEPMLVAGDRGGADRDRRATWCSRPRSRRSTACATSSTGWPTPRSAWRDLDRL